MEARAEAEENGREEEVAMKGCRFGDVENVGQVSEYQTRTSRGDLSA
jgi:hypothetical protein